MNIKVILQGISKPRNSREYKLAMFELSRSMAPLLAILVPTLLVIILMVITAVQSAMKETVQIEVAKLEDTTEELTEEAPEPEPQEIDMSQDVDVSVDVAVDVPSVSAPEAVQNAAPGGEPDAVQAAPSPVTMASIKGSKKMRGLGEGDGGGFGTKVGSGGGQNLEGALLGVIVDLKTQTDPNNPMGRDLGYVPYVDFYARLKPCVAGGFSDAACKGVRKLPKRVALTHLFIAPQPAVNGPMAFGVGDIMKDRGWVAHYEGELRCTEKARYRFWGYFDDFMLVKINNKVVWEYTWPCAQANSAGKVTGWKCPAPDLMNKYKSPQRVGMMAPGDWWDAAPGKVVKIEITCGETPGGAVGGILCIEQEGVKYEQYAGQPKFPIFASRRLSFKEIEKLESFKRGTADVWADGFEYKIGTEDIPLFNGRTKKESKAQKAREAKKAVQVEVDI